LEVHQLPHHHTEDQAFYTWTLWKWNQTKSKPD
jgi:hypothetical protein